MESISLVTFISDLWVYEHLLKLDLENYRNPELYSRTVIMIYVCLRNILPSSLSWNLKGSGDGV
jgi:hypothetical protein